MPCGRATSAERASRVVPAMGEMMARLKPARALSRVLLPALGRPISTAVGSELMGKKRAALIDQIAEHQIDFSEAVGNFCTGDEADILIDKIDSRFDQGERFGDEFHDGGHPAGEFAGEELAGGGKLALIQCCDGGGDAFGLGQIHFAIEESTRGEFARLGEASAVGDAGFDQPIAEELIAGQVKFEQVFAGVAFGGAEEIEDGGEAQVGEFDYGMDCRAVCGKSFANCFGDNQSGCATHPHNRARGRPGRGTEGDNGVS